jgi:hypothetical protein
MTTNLIPDEVGDPQIWYPMKLMIHKFDIPWSWWPTNLISHEVYDTFILGSKTSENNTKQKF